MAHTPGPWIDRHWDNNDQISITSLAFRGPNVLALVRPPLTGIAVGTDEETWQCTPCDVAEAGANARLIAAAPELLAACCDIVKDADDGKIAESWGIAAVRAAIAKATGE